MLDAMLPPRDQSPHAGVVDGKLSPDLLHRAFEHAPDAILVIDGRGRIAAVNMQTEALFGYDRRELVGELVERLVPERFAGRHVQHRTGYIDAPRSRSMGARLELFGRRKDASEFPVDVMLSPLQEGSGSLVLCVVRDVTDRRRAEEEFRGLLESAPDPMVIVDGDGRIVLVNSRTEQVFGYTRAELLDRPVEMLIPHRFRERHSSHRAEYSASSRVRPMGANLELYGRRADGSEFPVEVSLSPIASTKGQLVSSAIRDISERKEIERRTVESLREKEVLLKEIHHRVKNNLAVVSSLFFLQSTYTTDPRMIAILEESQDRVRSMALVHETLYGSDSLAVVDFAEYAKGLAGQLLRTYIPGPPRVQLDTEVEPMGLSIDIAVPCGLILNELVTNALKHAFPDGRTGRVLLRIAKHPSGWDLAVSDDGVGTPADVDVTETRTLGLRLVRSLARQVDATVVVARREPGTEFRVEFRSGAHHATIG